MLSGPLSLDIMQGDLSSLRNVPKGIRTGYWFWPRAGPALRTTRAWVPAPAVFLERLCCLDTETGRLRGSGYTTRAATADKPREPESRWSTMSSNPASLS